MDIFSNLEVNTKHLTKILNKMPRRKFMFMYMWLALISGICYFCVRNSLIILLLFIFSLTGFLYNLTYPLSYKIEKLVKDFVQR